MGDGKSLSDFATGYLFYGLHKVKDGWIFREWAPNATAIYLIGGFSPWREEDKFQLQPTGNGVWGIFISDEVLKTADL